MRASALTASRSARIPGLEGLRALAALAIVVLHLWSIPASVSLGTVWLRFLLEPLNEGVTLFFVLSGFLLWRPFASAIIGARELPSLVRYGRNRVLRIAPAYWTVLLLAAFVLQSARLTPLHDPPVDGSLHDPILLAKDALLVQNLTPGTLSSGLIPAWSLAVELVFYALVPLLALLAARLAAGSEGSLRRVLAALAPAVLLLLVGIVSNVVVALVVPGPEAVFARTWHSVLDRGFLTHADLFFAGMAVAVLRVQHERERLVLSARTRSILRRATLYSVPLVLAGFFVLPRSVYEPLVSLVCAALLALVVLRARSDDSRLVSFLERRPLVGAGLISYSIFLWCFPVAVFLLEHGLLLQRVGPWQVAVNAAIAIPVICTLATITYLLVERPALRLRRPLRRSARRAGRGSRPLTES
jgi:peptidoglycan/LPS O-acetylase OafA/YrhL